MFLYLLGFGLPILLAGAILSMPIKDDAVRSGALWLLVFPAMIGGGVLGAWLDSIV